MWYDGDDDDDEKKNNGEAAPAGPESGDYDLGEEGERFGEGHDPVAQPH